MRYNEHTVQLDEAIDALIIALKESDCFQRYQHAKRNVQRNIELQKQMMRLSELQQQYEEATRFQFKEKRRTYRKAYLKEKRALDEHPMMIEWRQSEFELQNVLDDIIQSISAVFKKEIDIDYGNPLKKKGCGNRCHE